MPTTRTPLTVAAVLALVATFVGAANAAGPGVSEVLMALGAMTALTLARSSDGSPR